MPLLTIGENRMFKGVRGQARRDRHIEIVEASRRPTPR